MTVPAPFVHYDFHEGSGSIAADILSNMPNLVAANPATAWNGQAAATEFRANTWNFAPPWTFFWDLTIDNFLGSTYTYPGQLLSVGGAGIQYQYFVNSGPSVNFFSAATNDIHSANGAISTGDHKIAYVNDGAGVKIYIDGVEVASGTGVTPAVGTFLVAEAANWPVGDLVNDIQIWNVALTSEQVHELVFPPVDAPASLSGSGALSGQTSPQFQRSSDLSGSGALSAQTSPKFQNNGDLSGDGTLSAATLSKLFSNPALGGDGALSAALFGVRPISTDLSGAGVLQATTEVIEGEPLPPIVVNSIEMMLHIQGTKNFIDADPTDIVLVPCVEQMNSGSKSMVDGTARVSQRFKIIWPGGDQVVTTSEGSTKKLDFVLVGMPNAQVDVGDHWSKDDERYRILEIEAPNGYEVKAKGIWIGKVPSG